MGLHLILEGWYSTMAHIEWLSDQASEREERISVICGFIVISMLVLSFETIVTNGVMKS